MNKTLLQVFLKKHKYLFPIIAVFAIVGSLLLVLGNAQAPQTDSDEILLATETTAGYSPISATGTFERTKTPKFSFTYDKTWDVFQFVDPNDSNLSFEQIRITSPGTRLDGQDHDGNAKVTTGNVIEISAAPNAQYASAEEFLAQLGDYVVYQKSTKLAGLQAIEYRLSSSLEYESSTKHITAVIHDGIQYSITLNNIDKTTEATKNAAYQQILKSFQIGE